MEQIEQNHPLFARYKAQKERGGFLYAPLDAELIMWVEDGRVLAYASLAMDGIELFEVVPDRQGEGVGTAIIASLKKDRPGLWRSGYSASQKAKKFWEKVGFPD